MPQNPQLSSQPRVLKGMEAIIRLPVNSRTTQRRGGEPELEGAATLCALEHDAQLMSRVAEGDETSFALLLDRHRAPVVHFLYRMVQNQAVSEELAQEVFLRVYKSRKSYQPTAKFTTWLFRIATHLALNALRDGKKERNHHSLDEMFDDDEGSMQRRQVADDVPTVEQEMCDDVQLKEIRSAIQALPEKQRTAVLLHKYEGLGYTQISKALECSESATKSMLFRAYETLRVRLAHLA